MAKKKTGRYRYVCDHHQGDKSVLKDTIVTLDEKAAQKLIDDRLVEPILEEVEEEKEEEGD